MSLGKQKRLVYASLAFAWAAFIFIESSTSDALGTGGLAHPWDKVAHACAFGLLAGLLYLASSRLWLSIVLACLYGLSDEFHQSFVAGRAADSMDFLADCIGAFIVVLGVYSYKKVKR